MDERFNVCEIHVCPVYKVGDSFKPDIEYPTRYCVIDNEKQIAIDIKTKLKYDYIQTMSHLYFISQSYKKIKGDNRVAILPYASLLSDGYDRQEVFGRMKENIEKFHSKRIKVNVWTVDDQEDGERIASYGADFITSNWLE